MSEALTAAIDAKDFDGAIAALKAGAELDDYDSRELLSKFGGDSFLTRTPEVAAERIRLLFANGVSPEHGGPALIVTSRGGLMNVAVKALLDGGVDVNFQNRIGYTALHNAAHCGSVELAKMLLAVGARMDLKDENKKTALQRASGDVLELLKAAGGTVPKAEPKKKKVARAEVPEALTAFLKGKAKEFESPHVKGLPTFGHNAAELKFLKTSKWDSFAEDLDLDPKEFPTLHPFAKLVDMSEFLVVDSATDALAVQMWGHEDEKFHDAFDTFDAFISAIRDGE